MKKDIKYILKRILIGVGIILVMSFLNGCEVKAIRTDGTLYSSPPNATFYANYSLTNHSALPGGFNTSIYSSAVINNLGGSSDAYGADVCMGLDMTLKGGYLYSVSIVLNNANNYAYTVASGSNYAMLRGGYALTTAINNANSMEIYYFGTVPTNNVVGLGTNFSNSTILNYLFVPKLQYNYICLPFKTTNVTSVIHNLLGYHLEVIGDTNGLSTADIQNAVNSSLSGLDSKFNAINNNINATNRNIAGVEANLSSQITTTRQQLNQKMTEINDTMNDDSTDDPDGKINDASSKVATDNVISQLVLLPVTLFTKVLASLNSTCVNYNLGELYGHNLTMPCIVIQNYVGGVLWNIIDILISGLLIYAISRKFVKVFNELSQMKEGDIID